MSHFSVWVFTESGTETEIDDLLSPLLRRRRGRAVYRQKTGRHRAGIQDAMERISGPHGTGSAQSRTGRPSVGAGTDRKSVV